LILPCKEIMSDLIIKAEGADEIFF
jgi:hypothetical protein